MRRRHRDFLWLDAEAMSLGFLLDIRFIQEITTDHITAKDVMPTKAVSAPRLNQQTEQASVILKNKKTQMLRFLRRKILLVYLK